MVPGRGHGMAQPKPVKIAKAGASGARVVAATGATGVRAAIPFPRRRQRLEQLPEQWQHPTLWR